MVAVASAEYLTRLVVVSAENLPLVRAPVVAVVSVVPEDQPYFMVHPAVVSDGVAVHAVDVVAVALIAMGGLPRYLYQT